MGTALLHESLQRAKIVDISRAGLDRAADGHVERVVVAVPVGIVALPEQPEVLLIGERGVVHAVRRVELEPSRDGHVRNRIGKLTCVVETLWEG